MTARPGAEDQPVGLGSAGRVEPADRPTGASGESATAPATARATPPSDREQRRAGGRQRRLPAAGAQRPQHREVRRGPADQLGQALADQHQQGQGGDPAEHGSARPPRA